MDCARHIRRFATTLAIPILIAAVFATAIPLLASDSKRSAAEVLAELQIRVTQGAAAGYIVDAVCGECHADKAESFANVAMSKSFYRPSADNVIEDFSLGAFFHEPSGRNYQIELRDGEYWFRRYRLAGNGRQLDVFERKIDWILGSGNHTRVYLYQTADGAMFELPLAWYTQERKWEMAPGFEWERHLGVMRIVRRQCMFCHNAYPEVIEGSDVFGMPEIFPHDLPQGIGCQRCHGPGAEHVAAFYRDDAKAEDARAAIVNPAKLPREQLYSICYGCHMQPAVAVPSVRRFGRNAYSFRPGEYLSDFRIDLDIKAGNVDQANRFEINHHPYRLEQSRCFIESKGALGCLTCHDPHVKIPAAERAKHYRAACLSCHGDERGNLELAGEAAQNHPSDAGNEDCTVCHMPERRTLDVIHVTMTDHRIAKNPGGLELIAPIEKEDTDIEEVFLRLENTTMSKDEETIYKAIGVLRYSIGTYEPAADRLEELLASPGSEAFEPWLELAESHLKRRSFNKAADYAREAALRRPGHPKIANVEAAALFSLGRKDEAIAILEQTASADAEELYRLAVMYHGMGNTDLALTSARKALKLRDNMWFAWRMIGEIANDDGRHEDAVEALRSALAIEPADDRSRAEIAEALKALGRVEEAADYDG